LPDKKPGRGEVVEDNNGSPAQPDRRQQKICLSPKNLLVSDLQRLRRLLLPSGIKEFIPPLTKN
jgi:hypothetical protein